MAMIHIIQFYRNNSVEDSSSSLTLKNPSDWHVSSNMLVAALNPSGMGCPGCGDQAKPVAQRYLIWVRERADITSSPTGNNN